MAGVTVGDDLGAATPLPTAQLQHMRDDDPYGGRVPVARFVAEHDASEVWTDGVTDRMLAGVNKTFTAETINAMKAGYICIRCLEPQGESFPLCCSLCGYAMRDRQIRDFSLEFEGEKHLGPSRPISEYIDELDAAAEKRKFDKKIESGGSRMLGLRGR